MEQTTNNVAVSEAPAENGAATDRDVQRSTLRDMLALLVECARSDTQIEHAHDAAMEQAHKQFQEAQRQLEQRYQATRDSITKDYQGRLAKFEAQIDAELATVEAAHKTATQRIEHDYNTVHGELTQKLEHAIWLAESLLEGARNQTRQNTAKAQEQFRARGEWLDSIREQAAAQIKRYRQQAPPEDSPATDAPPPPDPAAAIEQHREQIEQLLARLREIGPAKLFVGIKPALLLIALCVVAAAGAFFLVDQKIPRWQAVGGAVVGMLVLCALIGSILRSVARAKVRAVHGPLCKHLHACRHAAQVYLDRILEQQPAIVERAQQQCQKDTQAAKEKISPVLAKADQKRDALVAAAQADYSKKVSHFEAQRQKARAEVEARQKQKLDDLDQRYRKEKENLEQQHGARTGESGRRYSEGRTALERRWNEGLARLQEPIKQSPNGQLILDWSGQNWSDWDPPMKFPPVVSFGQLQVDLAKMTERFPAQLTPPKSFGVPALMAFPRQASLLIQTDRAMRDTAVRCLQMLMARLLTSLPPGRVRFTIVDPVSLGESFAGFMHLADYDENLVGGRIWTNAEHIEQRLTDLTEHMETVIQKYLRNEFATIDDYNAQAGELAEPYRFLVIADLPTGFSAEALNRLNSIVASGARCGVYTLIARDTRTALPTGGHLDELLAHSINLVQDGEKIVWKDEIFGQFPLMLDAPPPEDVLTKILHVVGKAAKDATRVEVPFETIAPPDLWGATCKEELRVPIGKIGATRQQIMRLGKGVAQHVLIAGKTGSGKSTLLHALVTNLAMWYSPDEVELYLVDFKKGVEFKTYATYTLPHARAIAVESDREFGLSVLQRIDAELTRRGEMFRRLGVQDLASYRQTSGQPMPRTLLVIDEFQEFFSEDDKLAQDAAVLMDRLVRQGRAFGIHVLLGSQTIGGSSGLARSTIGQMAVRIALQTTEADSQLILGDNNSAARLLSRPGEAIYNDQGGLVEGNSPFQIAWLPDEQREGFLKRVRELATQKKVQRPLPIVFEGNAPADLGQNLQLREMLSSPGWATSVAAPRAFMGEPVAIKDPTAVNCRRQSGANLLIVGQQEESAMAILASSIISLAAQQSPKRAKFYVFDGSATDSPLSAVMPALKNVIPHEINLVEWRSVADVINELAQEVSRRQSNPEADAPSIYVLIYALQRYRMLRHQEETFGGFSASGEEEAPKPNPDKQLADMLREGPPLGVHVLSWCDTPASVERTFDRTTLREFDNRVLFQMSAADSSNLIDSPAANKLGLFRALAYSEEQGTLEKFRPYALPAKPWLEKLKERLAAKASAPPASQ